MRSAGDTAVVVRCIINPRQRGRRCAGLQVAVDLARTKLEVGPGGLDGTVSADTRVPQKSLEDILAIAEGYGLSPGKVLAPGLLSTSPQPASEGAAT